MNIFGRIFLSFWLATVLAISISILSVTLHVAEVGTELSRSIPIASLQRCAEEVFRRPGLPNSPLLAQGDSVCKVKFALSAGDRNPHSQQIPPNLLYLVKRARTTGDLQVAPLPGTTVVAIPQVPASRDAAVVVFFMPSANSNPVRAFLWHAVPFSAAAALICFFLTGYITTPLKRLGMVADKIGAGDLTMRVVGGLDTRRDEFGDLARTFNRMADRIQELVTSQRMFLAHISHELGSPLTRLYLTLALTRRKAPSELTPELDRMEREATELNLLAQQLLLLARLESGNELSSQTMIFPISQVISEVAENAVFEAQQTNRAVTITRDADFHVAGNADLLKRAFDNVVRNAIRFTPEGTEVEIKVLARNGAGEITIRDNGPGIDPSAMPAIFEPFSQAGSSGPLSRVGLGLAIARHAVVAHKGQIMALNVPGGGLMVTVRLPIAPGPRGTQPLDAQIVSDRT